MTDRPTVRPARPHFSSGPCAKPPGWTATALSIESLGRSHRSGLCKGRLKHAIDLTREVLEIPDTHRVGIVPASDTGAFEMAMWTLLGPRGVTAVAWETFGEIWVVDAVEQLKLNPTVMMTPYGVLPDLARIDQDTDVLFTWNGTTAGVRVPNGDWIRDDRAGLMLCDATSGAFAQPLPWDKLDVTTLSWQKVLGSEAGHGILILGPRAVERLEAHIPAWPLPKLFRMTAKGKLIEGIFAGETINTPSMLAVEDCIGALEWARSIGGLPAMMTRSDANAAALNRWVEATPWVDHLAADPATRSNTGVCLKIVAPGMEHDAGVPKRIAELLEVEGVAFDVNNHRDAPPSLRVWCGATVDEADVVALGPWLDWAFHEATGK